MVVALYRRKLRKSKKNGKTTEKIDINIFFATDLDKNERNHEIPYIFITFNLSGEFLLVNEHE